MVEESVGVVMFGVDAVSVAGVLVDITIVDDDDAFLLVGVPVPVDIIVVYSSVLLLAVPVDIRIVDTVLDDGGRGVGTLSLQYFFRSDWLPICVADTMANFA